MNLEDRIYGPADIVEPVLVDLIESAPLQRLKGVLQHGVTALIGITHPVSRFEHTLGVMLLLRRLGAPLEEQIAALLHDASHTAFSHVIDYVFDRHEQQGFHEERQEPYLAASEVPDILSRYGYDWRSFLQDENFPLLERPAPELCADRLDYFFRDSLDLGLAPPEQVHSALEHLVVYGQRVVIDHVETARWAAETYIRADEASWANFREVGLYELAAQAIRTALAKGVIGEEDLWLTDVVLWEKLQAAVDSELLAQMRLVSPDTAFVWDEAGPDFWVSTKLRTIDPPVLLHGRLRPLSLLDPQFAARRSQYLRSKAGPWPVRVIPPGVSE